MVSKLNYSKTEEEIIKILSIDCTIYRMTKLSEENKPYDYLLSKGTKPLFYFSLSDTKCKIHQLLYGTIDEEVRNIGGFTGGTTKQVRQSFQELIRNTNTYGRFY